MIKEKVKGFWKEHKKEIILGGVIGVATVAGAERIFKKGYVAGFVDGGAAGFNLSIDWFNKNFPDTKLQELWDDYKKANPEEVVHRVGPGKWK